ncbi:MAG: hypothetical protein ACYDD5_00440 [Sulfuricurvum sp.]
MKTKKMFKVVVKPNTSYIFEEEVFFIKAYTEKQAKIVILKREQSVRSLNNRDLCLIECNEVNKVKTTQEVINEFLDFNYQDILENNIENKDNK